MWERISRRAGTLFRPPGPGRRLPDVPRATGGERSTERSARQEMEEYLNSGFPGSAQGRAGSADLSRIGAYHWVPTGDQWRWNPAMSMLHGYRPGAVTASRALVLAHKHPADRARAGELAAAVALHGHAYAWRHRILTVEGEVREVVDAGRAELGSAALGPRPCAPPVVRGYLLDLTIRRGRPAGVGRRIVEVDPAVSRAAGVVADQLGVHRDLAGELLVWLARARKLPVTTIAEHVRGAEDAPTPGLDALLHAIEPPDPRRPLSRAGREQPRPQRRPHRRPHHGLHRPRWCS